MTVNNLNLLTTKPMAYICNTAEEAAGTGNEYTRAVEAHVKQTKAGQIPSRLAMALPTMSRAHKLLIHRRRLPSVGDQFYSGGGSVDV